MHRSTIFKPLSPSKLAYAENARTTPAESTILNRDGLAAILPVYESKLGTVIHLNGRSPAASPITAEKKRLIKEKIAALQDDGKKYVTYLADHWCPTGPDGDFAIRQWSGYFNFSYKEILKDLQEYLDKDSLLGELSHEKSDKINKMLSQKSYTSLFQQMISKYIQFLTHSLETQCDSMTKDESNREICSLLSSEFTKPIVYVFTKSNSNFGTHTEHVLILKDSIVKPVTWHVDPEDELTPMSEFKVPFYHLDKRLSCFLISDNKSMAPVCIPQASAKDCGTLNLLVMKELLKNDHEQLREWTLQLSFYKNESELCHVYIPSPQCLRYSQVSTFNDNLAKIVSDQEGTFEVIKESKDNSKITLVFCTLKTALLNSLEIARKKGNDLIVKQNEAMLKKLPEFSARWQEKYKEVQAYRDLMKGPLKAREDVIPGANLLLVYHARKKEQKALEIMKIRNRLLSMIESSTKEKKDITDFMKNLVATTKTICQFADTLFYNYYGTTPFSPCLEEWKMNSSEPTITEILPMIVKLAEFFELKLKNFKFEIKSTGELSFNYPVSDRINAVNHIVSKFWDLFGKKKNITNEQKKYFKNVIETIFNLEKDIKDLLVEFDKKIALWLDEPEPLVVLKK